MRATARIAGNTSVILFGEIAGVALSIATVFILTANLSLAEFGHYNFVFFYILELKMVYPTVIDLSRNTVYLLGVLYVVRTERLGLSHLFALAVATSFVIAVVL